MKDYIIDPIYCDGRHEGGHFENFLKVETFVLKTSCILGPLYMHDNKDRVYSWPGISCRASGSANHNQT